MPDLSSVIIDANPLPVEGATAAFVCHPGQVGLWAPAEAYRQLLMLFDDLQYGGPR